jgi:hypothetical protein
MRTQTQNKILTQSGLLNKLRKELEIIQNEVKLEQNQTEYAEDVNRDILKEHRQTIEAIKNIYLRCQIQLNNNNQVSEKKTVELNPSKELLHKYLGHIKNRVVDLMEMKKESISKNSQRSDKAGTKKIRESNPDLSSPSIATNASGNSKMSRVD